MSLTMDGAGRQRGGRDIRLVGVDRDRNPQPSGERFDDRHDARALHVRGDRLRAGPRRLAADVDDVRAVALELQRRVDRVRDAATAPALGERIRRDVQDRP